MIMFDVYIQEDYCMELVSASSGSNESVFYWLRSLSMKMLPGGPSTAD